MSDVGTKTLACVNCGREYEKQKQKGIEVYLCLYCQLTEGDIDRQSRQNFWRSDRHRKMETKTS